MKNINFKKAKSYEELFERARKGNASAREELAVSLVNHARAMAISLKKTCPLCLDLDEMIGISHECVMRFFDSYQPGSNRVLTYFLTIYYRDVTRYISKKSLETSLFYYSLDENTYSNGNSTFHDALGSEEENPIHAIDMREIKLVLSDSDAYSQDKAKLQQEALAYLSEGYTVKELVDILDIPESTLRRLLKDEEDGMPLKDIKSKFISR